MFTWIADRAKAVEALSGWQRVAAYCMIGLIGGLLACFPLFVIMFALGAFDSEPTRQTPSAPAATTQFGPAPEASAEPTVTTPESYGTPPWMPTTPAWPIPNPSVTGTTSHAPTSEPPAPSEAATTPPAVPDPVITTPSIPEETPPAGGGEEQNHLPVDLPIPPAIADAIMN